MQPFEPQQEVALSTTTHVSSHTLVLFSAAAAAALCYKCNRDQWKTRPEPLQDGEWIGNPAEAASGYGPAGFDRLGGRRGSRGTGMDR
jgi:hypothetical protein